MWNGVKAFLVLKRPHGITFKSASRLNAWEAARLAVMLPRPKHYQKFPQSEYLSGRTDIVVSRMTRVQLP